MKSREGVFGYDGGFVSAPECLYLWLFASYQVDKTAASEMELYSHSAVAASFQLSSGMANFSRTSTYHGEVE